jgi:hypothetical protein
MVPLTVPPKKGRKRGQVHREIEAIEELDLEASYAAHRPETQQMAN